MTDASAPVTLLVDGNSLMHRAFHALPLLSYGEHFTNALQGFFGMLLPALSRYGAARCVVMLDEHGPTFRHAEYEDYKAGRPPTAEELRPQFPILRELLDAMGVPAVSLAGYEADDLLGSAARQIVEAGERAIILTGDRDALQLVTDDVSLLYPLRGTSDTTLFTPALVLERYGVTPAQVPDLKGLMGDKSDNIPGVPGVGEKTAVKLLAQYGTLENVLDSAQDIPGKLGERLRANVEQARFSKWLGTIKRTAPVPPTVLDSGLTRLADAVPVFAKYGMARIAGLVTKLVAERAAMGLDGAGGKRAPGLATAAATPLPATPLSPPPDLHIPVPASFEEMTPLPDADAIAAFSARVMDGMVAAIALGEQVTLALSDGSCASIALGGDLITPGVPLGEALWALLPALQKTRLIAHDAKALLTALAEANPGAEGAREMFGLRFVWDTCLGAYLCDPAARDLTLFALLPEAGGTPDARGVYALYAKQEQELREADMTALMLSMELPLMRVLFEMEQAGFQVDAKVLRALSRTFTGKVEALAAEVRRLLDEPDLNLNSPRQLADVLYGKRKLPPGKKRSTAADVLEEFIPLDPAIAPLLEYRQVSKLNSTYVDALLTKTDRTGRVHTTFNQTATLTGRISSLEPNLQNIPVRTPLGREIRRAFVAKEGCLLVDADYSQIELRVLAHMSGDEAMIDAFQRGQDIHARTAAEVFGVPLSAVTGDMRSSAKAVNFGIVYGISAYGLSKNTGVSLREAERFIARYFERYPGVHDFMARMVEDGERTGWTRTLFNRRRALVELTSGNRQTRAFGERAAMNTPVQGTAADIIKLAMVRVREALLDAGLQARLTLQVHDELVVECPEAEAQEAGRILRACMENVVALRVPLVAEVATGRSWYDTK